MDTRPTKLSFLIVIISSLFCLQSCNTSNRKPDFPTSSKSVERSLDPNAVDVVFARLDKANDVAKTVESTGAELDNSFLDIRKYPGAREDTARALVAGFLLADISYLVAYNHLNEANAYFPRLNELSGRIAGVRSETILDLAEAFEGNQDNQDSLDFFLHELYHRTTSDLNAGEYNDRAVLFLTALVLENMHVNARMIDEYPADMLEEDTRTIVVLPLISALLSQEPYLEDVITLLQHGAKTPFNHNLTARLENINGYFDQLNIDQNMRDNRIDLVLPDTTFIQTRQVIASSRNWLLSQIR